MQKVNRWKLSLITLFPPETAGYQVGRIYGRTCQYPSCFNSWGVYFYFYNNIPRAVYSILVVQYLYHVGIPCLSSWRMVRRVKQYTRYVCVACASTQTCTLQVSSVVAVKPSNSPCPLLLLPVEPYDIPRRYTPTPLATPRRGTLYQAIQYITIHNSNNRIK